MISGIGAAFFGHSHEEIAMQAVDAAMTNCVMQGNLQQNDDSLTLSRLLCSTSGLDHCFLSSSGAMACENSCKICFQKAYPATRILAFENGFSGRTCLLSQISDKPQNRQGIPAAYHVDFIPFFDSNNPHASTENTLTTLKKLIKRYPGQHAFMCMELILGEGGSWVGSEHFFKEIISVLKENNILVWVDEVQTFLRTSQPFAFQHFHLDGLVDTVTVGKSLQACATLFTEAVRPQPGLLSQTFTASTSAIKTGTKIVEHALQAGFFGPNGKIMQLDSALHKAFSRLNTRFGDAVLSGPYGLGGMAACTLFQGDFTKTKEFLIKLFENGVIAFIAGKNPARVRFLPPIGAFDLADIDPVIEIFEHTIRQSL